MVTKFNYICNTLKDYVNTLKFWRESKWSKDGETTYGRIDGNPITYVITQNFINEDMEVGENTILTIEIHLNQSISIPKKEGSIYGMLTVSINILSKYENIQYSNTLYDTNRILITDTSKFMLPVIDTIRGYLGTNNVIEDLKVLSNIFTKDRVEEDILNKINELNKTIRDSTDSLERAKALVNKTGLEIDSLVK